MIVFENHCCDCAVPGYPCLGSACPLRNVPVHYCDKCGAEIREGDLCEECEEDE